MGYDIYIGQAVLDDDWVDEHSPRLCVKVKEATLPEAPAFDNDLLSQHNNSRHPGYIAWSNFLKAAGLEDLFSNEDNGLMCDHPGCCKLFESHYTRIHAALEAYKQAHPDAIPGFESLEFGGMMVRVGGAAAGTITQSDPGTEPDGILARLMWLDWWVRWALDNTTIPAIYNF